MLWDRPMLRQAHIKSEIKPVLLVSTSTLPGGPTEADSGRTQAHRREGPQDFHPILRCERVRRVHAGEVGEARGWVRGCPAQHVAELRCVGIDGVPGDQELGRKQGDDLAQAVPEAP